MRRLKRKPQMIIFLIAYFDFLVILMLHCEEILTLILEKDFSNNFEDISNVNFRETIWQILDKVKADLLSKVHQKLMLLIPINTN